ncbi:hypothetical protein BHE74_00031674, partial [Ensete ventricosum]
MVARGLHLLSWLKEAQRTGDADGEAAELLAIWVAIVGVSRQKLLSPRPRRRQ